MTKSTPDAGRTPAGPRARAMDAFERRFVRPPAFVVRAPGRVNLIGEHTDYTGGLVLPFAIDRALFLAAAPRDDARVRAFACDLGDAGQACEFEFDELERVVRAGGFASYIAAVALALREQGGEVRGLDLALSSDIPLGSGLSSSAALGVASALAFDAAAGGGGAREALARCAHRAESHFVGTGCGILDPYAIALCEPAEALRIDCGSRETRSLPLPASELAFVITHSGVERKLAGEDAGRGYRERVEACARGFEALCRAHPGRRIASLRECAEEDLAAAASALDPVWVRRLRHVISENARVDRMCRLLEAEGAIDLPAMGAILRASHSSLRDDYEVSIAELDALCETADGLSGVYGSRMVGAGFGGCALHLVAAAACDEVARALRREVAARSGRELELFVVRADRGARVEALI